MFRNVLVEGFGAACLSACSAEAGRYGDLVAVRGDPLADITVLEHVDVVIKGGRRYK